MLDAQGKANGHGLLHAVEHLLANVFIPSLRRLEKGWGALDSAAGSQTRDDFLNMLDSFVSVLVGRFTFRFICSSFNFGHSTKMKQACC